MIKYPKIQSIFKRDSATRYKTFLPEYSTPEIEYLKDCQWEFTEKIDGTNIQVHWDGEHITYGGRTENSQIPAILVNRLRELFTQDDFQKQFDEDVKDVTLFGEGFGAKIQKGGGNYLPNGVDFALFDVIVCGVWLESINVSNIAEGMGLTRVSRVAIGTIQDAIDIVRPGFNSVFGEFRAEGLVLRPKVVLFNHQGERIMTKVKTKDYQ